jgi:hypothetical protein
MSSEVKVDTYLARLYIPNVELSVSHIMTMGEKTTEIRLIPKGWSRKSRISIAHVTPMIVDFVMVLSSSFKPWTAPRTDCAGVNTPSAMAIDTAKTPIACKR